MIHNLNYVIAAYGLTFIIIGGYILWVSYKRRSIKKMQKNIKNEN